MSEELDWTAVSTSAEKMLARKFSRVERFSDDGRLNLMLRCTLATALDDGTTSVVIKQMLPYHQKPKEIQAHDMPRFWRDWAGAALLTAVAPKMTLAPRFYGGDAVLNFIVLEDLGTGTSLVEPLLQGNSAAARAALLQLIRQLGRMHAATKNQRDQFVRLLQNIEPEAVSTVANNRLRSLDLQKLAADITAICSLPAGFLAEAEQVINAVTRPGPFTTFIHGDICPDNLHSQNGQMHIIDFERSHYGHALRDALYPRMNFPTCWCANQVPPDIIDECEAVYRTETVQAFPEMADDLIFSEQRLYVAASWLLDTLSWMLVLARDPEQADAVWGIASIRGRILTHLSAFLSLAEAPEQLPALHDTAVALFNTLQKSWPETNILPTYPAFQAEA